MNWKDEWKKLVLFFGVFLGFYYMPVDSASFSRAILEAFHLVKWYAREHVILCLVPAFFIAGAIAVFIKKEAVMKYLGAKAKKVVSYGVASVSGSVLAVCSCTVLPLFAGIYRMGAGLGPATAFLYAGPAINVLAIILSARVLGIELGIARALGAVIFSIIIGLTMHFIFRNEEMEKASSQIAMPEAEVDRPLWKNALYFASMVGILVFANWGAPSADSGLWAYIYDSKWLITAGFGIALGFILFKWFWMKPWKIGLTGLTVLVAYLIVPAQPLVPFSAAIVMLGYFLSTGSEELNEWFFSSWDFAKQILPLLLFGVFFAGIFLGRPGHEGIIPSSWIAESVGGNSILSNFFASFAGAFMYFATLTEIPILEGLLANGMGNGPALALLLAGPALSLPNMLVIRSVLGTKKTVVFITLVIVMSTISGFLFGLVWSW